MSCTTSYRKKYRYAKLQNFVFFAAYEASLDHDPIYDELF